jgi:hypothetical protein
VRDHDETLMAVEHHQHHPSHHLSRA